MMTVRHGPPSWLGFTHASRVMPAVRSRLDESGTVTIAFVPLNWSALPYLPVVTQVALAIEPLLPRPEVSPSEAPLPSSKEYAATSPAGAFVTTALACGEAGPTLPAASSAVTR